MKKSYFYIVECRDGSLYAGITLDLGLRLKYHNAGKGGKYTRSRRPVSLLYSEEYSDLSLARKREGEVKKWSRAKKIELITSGVSLGLRPRD